MNSLELGLPNGTLIFENVEVNERPNLNIEEMQNENGSISLIETNWKPIVVYLAYKVDNFSTLWEYLESLMANTNHEKISHAKLILVDRYKEIWTLDNPGIINVDFGELDYSSDSSFNADIGLTIKYDGVGYADNRKD